MAPRPATPSVPTTPTCAPQASESSWGVDDLRPKQERWAYDEQQQQGGGAPWGWGGVQSVYLGGGGAKGLATVTPLNAHNYLEGVWRVSCCRPELQQTTVSREGQTSLTCCLDLIIRKTKTRVDINLNSKDRKCFQTFIKLKTLQHHDEVVHFVFLSLVSSPT